MGTAAVAAVAKYVERRNRDERRWTLLQPMLSELGTEQREREQLSQARELINNYEMAKAVIKMHQEKEDRKEKARRRMEDLEQQLELLRIKLQGLEGMKDK